MPDKKLTEELLNELLDAPNIDGYIKEHDFAAPSLSARPSCSPEPARGFELD